MASQQFIAGLGLGAVLAISIFLAIAFYQLGNMFWVVYGAIIAVVAYYAYQKFG